MWNLQTDSSFQDFDPTTIVCHNAWLHVQGYSGPAGAAAAAAAEAEAAAVRAVTSLGSQLQPLSQKSPEEGSPRWSVTAPRSAVKRTSSAPIQSAAESLAPDLVQPDTAAHRLYATASLPLGSLGGRKEVLGRFVHSGAPDRWACINICHLIPTAATSATSPLTTQGHCGYSERRLCRCHRQNPQKHGTIGNIGRVGRQSCTLALQAGALSLRLLSLAHALTLYSPVAGRCAGGGGARASLPGGWASCVGAPGL